MVSPSPALPPIGMPDDADQPYRMILEQMGDGVGTLSADGRLLYANPRLAELLEQPCESLLDRPLAELIPPAQRDCLERLRKVSPGRTERAELELLRAEGGTMRVLAAVSGLEGSRIGTQCLTLTDLSGLQSPGTPLASVDHRFRLLAEAVAAFVVETDAQRRVRWVSPSVHAVLGWMPRDVVGSCITDLLHQEDSLEAEPPAGERQPLVRLRAKDGTDRWMRYFSWPLTGEGRTTCGWISGFQDVDGLIEQRQASAKDQARLAAVLASLPEPQIVLDTLRWPDGALLDFVCAAANGAACREAGLDGHQLVGRRLLDAFPAPSAAGLFALCRRVLETQRSLVWGELDQPSGADGEKRRCTVRISRVGDVLSCCWGERVDIAAGSSALGIHPGTDLVSRAELLERLSQLRQSGYRRTQPLALAFCDLSKLRPAYDGHGTDGADIAVRTSAERLRRVLRPDDILARVSPDQLLVVLSGISNHAQAAAMAESMSAVMRLPSSSTDASPWIMPSVGITLERPGEKLEDLISGALTAMERARAIGPGRLARSPGPGCSARELGRSRP